MSRLELLLLTALAAQLHRRRPGLPPEPRCDRVDRPTESGQATTEYALVLLAAALVALLVVAWATSGGGAAKIGELFNNVVDSVIGRV